MGIFSKKTNESIGTTELEKRVEQYNQKFLASVEQPKAVQSQARQPVATQAATNVPAKSTQVSQARPKPVTGNFDSEGFRVVSEENMNYAYGHMHRFLGTIVNEKVKAITLTCFDGDIPSGQSLRAASQFFNLAFQKIWHIDTYSLDDMKYDMDRLCDFINEQDDLGLMALMMGYSKYIAQEIRMNLKNGGFTDEEVTNLMYSIESARDTIFEVTEKKMH